MAEEKAKPPPEVYTSYMAIRSKERQGDIPLYEVLKIERRNGKLVEVPMDNIHPGTRMTIRERLVVLNSGKDVLPW